MAKITLDLNQFKASGVYTIEYDQSQSIVVTSQTVRLVVGFSRTGPFNAPVFLQNVTTSRKIFGTIDSFLEKRGSFFHRTLETCLQTAPVFALNLLPLNNIPVSQGGDGVSYRGFALAANEDNGTVNQALLASFFNKERFWFPDEKYLQATVDEKPTDTGKLFNIVNIGQAVLSVLIVKSTNASQYNIKAQDYYGSVGNVPAYINPLDFLSDYFVDVYIVQGDWTNLVSLSQDPIYSKYFDTRGIIASQLANFLSLSNVTLVGSFTGTIIPDFIDNNGSNQSIDVIINSASTITGIFCNLNATMFDDYENSRFKLDMIGNSLINSDRDIIDFLSYNTPISSILEFSGHDYYTGITDGLPGSNLTNTPSVTTQAFNAASTISPVPYVTSYPFGDNRGLFNNILVIPQPAPSDTVFTVDDYNSLLSSLSPNMLIKTNGTYDAANHSTEYANNYVKVETFVNTGTEIEITLSSPNNTNDYYFGGSPASAGTPLQATTTATEIPSVANTLNVYNFAGITGATGDILLVQYPGYTNYFQLATITPGTGGAAGTSTITVATTLGTGSTGYYLKKYGSAGFPATDFAACTNAGNISVTILDTKTSAAVDTFGMVPNIGSASPLSAGHFAYIANPDFTYSKLSGVGQTLVPSAVDNAVTLYNVTQGTGLTGAYLQDSGTEQAVYLGSAVKAYNITSSSAAFGYSRVLGLTGGTATVNPFAGGATGDLIKVTVPGGQSYYGIVNKTGSLLATGSGAYNLAAPGTAGTSVASLAVIEGYPGSSLATNINSNNVVNGDQIQYGAGTSQYNYLGVNKSWSTTNDPYTRIAYGLVGASVQQYTNTGLATTADTTFADVNTTYASGSLYSAAAGLEAIAINSSLASNISETITILSPGLYGGGLQFQTSATTAANLNVGDYVVNNNSNNPLLVRVTSKVKTLDALTGAPTYVYTVLDVPAVNISNGIYTITKYSSIQNFANRYQFTLLDGFTLTSYHLPDGSETQLSKIYGVLENTNLSTTLADTDIITFRYIVDTFNNGLQPKMGAKQILSRLAMNRKKCLAILNAPSIQQFINSTDPRFTELPDAANGNPLPVLNTAYINTGGNLSLGPSFTWGLPDEGNGSKYCGVFAPNIIVLDNNKNLSVPPAGDVSNNFINKFLTGQPYGIVAGPRRGVINNPNYVKMEYELLSSDRSSLEPIGVNSIVNIKNVGPMIYANQTGYQSVISALNSIHVRDLLITIEEGIEEILTSYLFEFNDASTQLEIRQIVSTYLDGVLTNGGIGNYEVIMDGTNNTPSIIGNNFGILDVGVEPLHGLQKFINRVSILKTGTISSGGFSAA